MAGSKLCWLTALRLLPDDLSLHFASPGRSRSFVYNNRHLFYLIMMGQRHPFLDNMLPSRMPNPFGDKFIPNHNRRVSRLSHMAISSPINHKRERFNAGQTSFFIPTPISISRTADNIQKLFLNVLFSLQSLHRHIFLQHFGGFFISVQIGVTVNC